MAASHGAASTRQGGMSALLRDRPALFTEMVLRTALATILVTNVDAFLKLVVTPVLAATVVGAVLTPFTFFMGQALQPC